MKRLSPVPLSLTLVLCAVTAQGQESRALINGTVTDPQGAVVPAANIEIKNLETNVISKAITNDRGLYASPPLNPGVCSDEVAATVVKTTMQQGVDVGVAVRVLLDFKLDLSGTIETVNVNCVVPLLEPQTASQGTVISKELVAAIPPRGRDVF